MASLALGILTNSGNHRGAWSRIGQGQIRHVNFAIVPTTCKLPLASPPIISLLSSRGDGLGQRQISGFASSIGGTTHMLGLPSPAIDLGSSEGRELLKEAMSDGTADGFFRMFPVSSTQSKLTACGLSSLSNVLNALRIDPNRSLMGVWWRYSEEMLVDAEMSKKIEKEGITFKELAEVACRQEVEVEAFQTNRSSVELFREKVKKATSSPLSFIIACYSRGVLSQKGDGHFSPLVAYHARRDMVLIIDVASFKYPPHWIPFNLLWEAMTAIDKKTGEQRGFMNISKRIA